MLQCDMLFRLSNCNHWKWIALGIAFVFLVKTQVVLGKSPPDLVTRFYILPASVFALPDTNNPDGTPKPNEGVKLLTSSNDVNGITYDVSKFLSDNGVPWPKGSEAIYFLSGNMLVVRNRLENVDLCETLLTPSCMQPFQQQLSSEFIVGTFALPVKEEIHQPIPYSKFMKQVGDTWKVVNQLTATAPSGQQTKSSGSLGKSDKKLTDSASVKAPSETHINADVEMVLGPDGNTIHSSFTFGFQGLLGPSEEVGDISLANKIELWNGYSSVIYLSKIASVTDLEGKHRSQRYVAVILKVSISNPGGWKIKTR